MQANFPSSFKTNSVGNTRRNRHTIILANGVSPSLPPLLDLYEITMAPKRKLEIAGLYLSTDGRHCDEHPSFGRAVALRDLLVIKKESLVINGRQEEVGAAYHVVDRVTRCKVGFVHQARTLPGLLNELNNSFVMVDEMYADSKNRKKRTKDDEMHGMCLCVVVNPAFLPDL